MKARRDDAPLQRTVSLPAMKKPSSASADHRSPSVVAAASFRLPAAMGNSNDLSSVAMRMRHAQSSVGDAQASTNTTQQQAAAQASEDPRVDQVPVADTGALDTEESLLRHLHVLCSGGWCYKKTGPEERFKLEPRFVWLGFLRDPRKAASEAEKVGSVALFWDKSAPKASTVACEATALDGRVSLT